jgi:hypothetical protein
MSCGTRVSGESEASDRLRRTHSVPSLRFGYGTTALLVAALAPLGWRFGRKVSVT